MTKPYTIRNAEQNDLEAIVEMLADDDLGAVREDISRPLNQRYVSAFATICSDPNHQVLVVEKDEAIIGTLQVSCLPGLSRTGMWRGQIESVRVTKPYQGDGLGRALIEAAISWCQSHHCGLVQLTTDYQRSAAQKFYESLGFKTTHKGLKFSLQ